MITSKQRSLLGLAALVAIASTQACGSDENPVVPPQAGAPGAGSPAAAGTPGAGMPGVAGVPGGAGLPALGGSSGAGAPGIAGASAGGAPAAGAPAGGAPAGGAGGASAGSGGGSSGGSAGKGSGGGSAAGAGGGGSTGTFAQVTAIINMSCTSGNCHSASSNQVNFKTPSPDLYTVLTTAIPSSVMHCKGTTLVVPNDVAGSFLVSVVKGAAMCKNNGANENIPKMPDNCQGNTCLTTAQINTISSWIMAGAPK